MVNRSSVLRITTRTCTCTHVTACMDAPRLTSACQLSVACAHATFCFGVVLCTAPSIHCPPTCHFHFPLCSQRLVLSSVLKVFICQENDTHKRQGPQKNIPNPALAHLRHQAFLHLSTPTPPIVILRTLHTPKTSDYVPHMRTHTYHRTLTWINLPAPSRGRS